jgi:multimeric flavodoxin WrbA
MVVNRYYSMYGHVAKLAEEIQKGASSIEGVEAKLWQVSFLSLFHPVYLCFITLLQVKTMN